MTMITSNSKMFHQIFFEKFCAASATKWEQFIVIKFAVGVWKLCKKWSFPFFFSSKIFLKKSQNISNCLYEILLTQFWQFLMKSGKQKTYFWGFEKRPISMWKLTKIIVKFVFYWIIKNRRSVEIINFQSFDSV